MTDSARIRQLEQERDAAIRERDEALRVRDPLGHECARCKRMLPASHYQDRIVCNGCNGKAAEERDAAVAACAAMRDVLERAGKVLVGPDDLLDDIDAALSTAPGARLLEERRLLRAFVAAWDTKRTKHEHEVHAARDAILRFDEGGEGEAT